MTTTTTSITPFVEDLLIQALHPPLSALENIFQSADEFGARSMQISWLQAAFLQMLVKVSNSKNILEVGTFVGFSASVFATASPLVESVVTCEVLLEHHQRAVDNFVTHGLSSIIKPILGDAKDLLSSSDLLWRKFDIFFLDGDKENYDFYLDTALSVLLPGGLFIVDNILFKGELAGGQSKYVKGIRSLFEKVNRHPDFDICYATIADGMLIARRR
jgi:caffeoyl-CoA O-methyltransferase